MREELLAELGVALVERARRPPSASALGELRGRARVAPRHRIAEEIELQRIGQSAEIARLGQLAGDAATDDRPLNPPSLFAERITHRRRSANSPKPLKARPLSAPVVPNSVPAFWRLWERAFRANSMT
jgi:hypothetical protein